MSLWPRSDRPLRRALVKLACRLLGNDRAHFHSWLPSLTIVGRTQEHPGVVLFRRRKLLELAFIDALRLRASQRIVIVGSGPSINDADLSVLPPHSAILLNGAIHLIGAGVAEPLAVAIEDERFIWRHFDLVRDQLGPDTLLLLAPEFQRR